MNINFELILTVAVLITGMIWLLDVLFLASRRKRKVAAAAAANVSEEQLQKLGTMSLIVEYSRSFFPILLIVLLIRSFLVQPFRVPTGSLEPTVMPGDFIAVNQYAYGLRLPVLHTKALKVGEPKVGDIVVFRWPPNPSIDYVKRVIGVPGDHVVYKNKVLYINGKKAPQTLIGDAFDIEPQTPVPVLEKQEDLMGVKHMIFVRPNYNESGDFSVVVPKGEYFMMGDNRDNSSDSRFWGFVPEHNIIGKAFLVWMSWDSHDKSVRWKRIGTVI